MSTGMMSERKVDRLFNDLIDLDDDCSTFCRRREHRYLLSFIVTTSDGGDRSTYSQQQFIKCISTVGVLISQFHHRETRRFFPRTTKSMSTNTQTILLGFHLCVFQFISLVHTRRQSISNPSVGTNIDSILVITRMTSSMCRQ